MAYNCQFSLRVLVCLIIAVSLLEPLKETLQSATGVSLELTVKTKGQEEQQLSALLDGIKALGNATVGTLPKEVHTGQLADLWAAKLANSGLQTTDATSGKLKLQGHHCN